LKWGQSQSIIDGLLLLSSVSRERASTTADMSSLVANAIERLEILIDRRKAEIKRPDNFPVHWDMVPGLKKSGLTT
jgi:hypothetical protein